MALKAISYVSVSFHHQAGKLSWVFFPLCCLALNFQKVVLTTAKICIYFFSSLDMQGSEHFCGVTSLQVTGNLSKASDSAVQHSMFLSILGYCLYCSPTWRTLWKSVYPLQLQLAHSKVPKMHQNIQLYTLYHSYSNKHCILLQCTSQSNVLDL